MDVSSLSIIEKVIKFIKLKLNYLKTEKSEINGYGELLTIFQITINLVCQSNEIYLYFVELILLTPLEQCEKSS